MRHFALGVSDSKGRRCVSLILSCLALLAIFILAPLGANAQLAGTGTIEGSVTDPSGAVIPDAEIKAVNTATGEVTIRASTKSGLYSLSPLTPGIIR